MLKYPSNIIKKNITISSHRNRGMSLENMINKSNEYYLDKDIALIYKKPTPIGTVKVSYENRTKIINKAYFQSPSTLDYNGIYKGRYIEFEAKETKNKTSFPLSNIHQHQINHLRKVLKHKGIGFLIINMNALTYLLRGEDFIEFIDTFQRRSIPYNYLKEHGFIINPTYPTLCDYLKIVNDIYF